LLLGRYYLTVESVRLFPPTHGGAPPANKSERRSDIGVFKVQDDRRFVFVDRNGLFFTHALLRSHFLPAVRFVLNAPTAFTERFPFTWRFVLRGLPGAILGEYNEAQT